MELLGTKWSWSMEEGRYADEGQLDEEELWGKELLWEKGKVWQKWGFNRRDRYGAEETM
jgi:hypothetical protein